MKTLSFLKFKVGYDANNLLFESDTSRDEVTFVSGTNIVFAPNGVGKSTLLKTLSGAMRPLSGEVRFQERRLKSSDVFYMSEYLSVPKYIYPKEWLEYRCGRKLDDSQILEIAKLLRLEHKYRSYLGQMSQGERRKWNWLCCHFSARPILALDEPFEGLDFFAVQNVRSLFENWNAEGRVVLLVTHHMSEVLDLTSSLSCIHQKRLRSYKSLTFQNLDATNYLSTREALLKLSW